MTKLQDAYDTISDPTRRRAYDLRWPSIRDGLRARQESEKRQAEATQAEAKRAAEARARKQQEEKAREERLQNLEQDRWKYEDDIFELSRVIRKLVADLKRLKDQDDEDARKEKERNGWWAYLTSPIYGKVKEMDEQKQERDNKRLQRNAAKTIKESDVAAKEAKLQQLQNALRDVNGRIAAEKNKVEDEKRRVEAEERARKMKIEEEERYRAMRDTREMMVRRRREHAEEAAKKAREAQAAREAWEAQEREREAQEREETRRQMEILRKRAEAIRKREEAAKNTREVPNHRSGRATQSTCRHHGWWPKVEGRQLCGRCNTFQHRFLLQCPGCNIMACASCSKSLRGERPWENLGGGTGRPYGFTRNHGYEPDDIPSWDHDYEYEYD